VRQGLGGGVSSTQAALELKRRWRAGRRAGDVCVIIGASVASGRVDCVVRAELVAGGRVESMIFVCGGIVDCDVVCARARVC
jgi:hypothetical protein